MDGCCLTVTSTAGREATFDLVPETLQRTALGALQAGALVNFERSLKFGDEVGGHILSGHVDVVAEIVVLEVLENSRKVTFRVPSPWSKYLFEKGYVALNGASLTITRVDRAVGDFDVSLIPETLLYCFLNSSTLFFTTITVFLTNPFRYLKAPMVMPDGNGLNPLLQNEYMAIHPPMLYLGFTGLAIPYAFCMAALASGHITNDWIRLTRRWTLIGWTFLTAGIVLGGHWAYLELGWGGFWAWDPVENSSFLPWLTATAFLHSSMVQERKGMLKVWNVFLCVLTYALTVFGTFLTRSGVVQSVHAFLPVHTVYYPNGSPALALVTIKTAIAEN